MEAIGRSLERNPRPAGGVISGVSEKMTGFSGQPPSAADGETRPRRWRHGLPGQSPPAAFDFTIPT